MHIFCEEHQPACVLPSSVNVTAIQNRSCSLFKQSCLPGEYPCTCTWSYVCTLCTHTRVFTLFLHLGIFNLLVRSYLFSHTFSPIPQIRPTSLSYKHTPHNATHTQLFTKTNQTSTSQQLNH